MGRKLNQTLLVDGVVYAIGTDEDDIDGEITVPGVWGSETNTDAPSAPSDSGDLTAELAARDEKLKAAADGLAARDEQIEAANSVLGRLAATVVQLREGSETEDQPDYLAKSKPELENEVKTRNADRDPDGVAYIRVEAPGNKPEIAAALVLDDARTSDN